MPFQYSPPSGGTRQLEFWKQGRAGEKTEIISVPADWDEFDIKSELDDWGSQHFPTSSFTRYGWNDVKDFGSRK